MATKKSRRKPKTLGIQTTHRRAQRLLGSVPLDELIPILLKAGDEKIVSFGHALASPGMTDLSMTALCARMDVRISDVTALFKEHQLALGTLAQMQHAPRILESNARAAIGREVPCPTCRGKGAIFDKCLLCDGLGKREELLCPSCEGAGLIEIGPCKTCERTGWVMDAGQTAAVKGFMESAGLIGKPSGPLVNINQNFGGRGDFEDLMLRTEEALDKRKAIDITGERR